MKNIRPLYDKHGVEDYYREHAGAYENPHFPEIKVLLERNLHRIDTRAVLDFGAGGGEVTQVLQGLGLKNMTGCDPFTFDLYEKNTGLPCLRLAFKDVVKSGLGGKYSAVISSFALHLCPLNDLYMLCWNLFQAAPLLVVLTPHKRPELERLTGIQLLWEDTTHTDRGKRVRCKAYRLENAGHC